MSPSRPWSRSMSRHRLLAGVTALGSVLVFGIGVGHTYARFTDFLVFKNNHIGAGVWAPDPPAACGKIADYKGGVVYGTQGNDVLNVSSNNQRQIVMGYGGNDTIY